MKLQFCQFLSLVKPYKRNQGMSKSLTLHPSLYRHVAYKALLPPSPTPTNFCQNMEFKLAGELHFMSSSCTYLYV